MTNSVKDSKETKPKVVYSLRTAKAGQGVFTDIRLPDGTILRQVDRSVHERALQNASKRYLEKYGR
ncbi:hypothetical protein [Aurantimonas sp. Leaf443]|uniref:hypothetical protein n=1 Tax=Aurantimonas sp. Leaf443 TaxID=1736378 RepID=UPI0006F5DD9C|nr:hypothetical protein [Aurantimonas sp. Leaf443]KQT85565.1 hypothetical protein ASG48_10175 [Aurantimonas sp. Leaf443]